MSTLKVYSTSVTGSREVSGAWGGGGAGLGAPGGSLSWVVVASPRSREPPHAAPVRVFLLQPPAVHHPVPGPRPPGFRLSVLRVSPQKKGRAPWAGVGWTAARKEW